MGKFDGVLLVTDYDATFGVGDNIPKANLEAVAYFQSEGGRFTVATGRAPHSYAVVRHLIPVNAPVILSNGSHLYDTDTGETVLKTDLPATAVEDLSLVLQEFPKISVEAYHGDAVYICNPNHWTDRHTQMMGAKTVELPLAEMPQPWDKALLEQDYELLLPVRNYVLEHWSDRYEAVFSARHMLEITAKGCTKGGMVLELARLLGIHRENLYCVGDNQNDIPMLAVSAIPFAPGNCTPEVRDFGARLLPPCEEGTIATLIQVLDEKY